MSAWSYSNSYSLYSAPFRANILNIVTPVINGLGITSAYRRFLTATRDNSVAILMYHRVAEPPKWADGLSLKSFSATPQQFEEHLQLLSKRFKVFSLEQYLNRRTHSKRISSNAVILTFDDGYRDNFLHAFPLLRKYQLPATVFVTTGLVGTTRLPWWERVIWHIAKSRLPQVQIEGTGWLPLNTPKEKHFAIYTILKILKLMPPKEIGQFLEQLIRKLVRDPDDEPRERLFLTWEEAREMQSHGISFGAHSVSHPNLVTLGRDEVIRELADSKAAIESELKTDVQAFAYPFGEQDHFNEQVKTAVKDAGFQCAATALYGRHNQKEDLFALLRIPIFATQSRAVFYMKLSGLFEGFAKFM